MTTQFGTLFGATLASISLDTGFVIAISRGASPWRCTRQPTSRSSQSASIASMIALGSGLGPVMVGLLYDIAGDYSRLKLVGIPGALVCALLLWKLGPYPGWNRTPSDQMVFKPQ